MPKPSAISVFVAATSLLVSSAGVPALQAQDAGGLKEWNTDQGLDEESILDADAAALKKKAEQEDICVPIGEGENCWWIFTWISQAIEGPLPSFFLS